MDKENRGNWRRFCLPAGLALCAAAILAAQTGCSSQQGEPVIAERTSQAEQPQGGKEISDAGGETKGADAEEPEKRPAYTSGTFTSASASSLMVSPISFVS